MLHNMLDLLQWLHELSVCCGSCLCHSLLVKDLYHLLCCCLQYLLSGLHCGSRRRQNEFFNHNQVLSLILIILDLLQWEFLLSGVAHGQLWCHSWSPILALWRGRKPWFDSRLHHHRYMTKVWCCSMFLHVVDVLFVFCVYAVQLCFE